MNLDHSIPKKTGLLVSVRSVEEAKIALHANVASIIDVKEPLDGSLGCVSLEVAKSIAESLPTDVAKSIALGEVVEWPTWAKCDSSIRNEILSKYQFLKLGLSGLGHRKDWIDIWHRCLSDLPNQIERVAVAYADSKIADCPPIELIVTAGVELGCSVLLVDTFSKRNGSLFDHISKERLRESIDFARDSGLKIVLAGSLSKANIPIACSLVPDLIAVRGAVCGSDRTSPIQLERLKDVASSLAIDSLT